MSASLNWQGANAQVCLEKFARYFEVEARLVPVSEDSRYCLDVKKAAEMCDENTIGGAYTELERRSDAGSLRHPRLDLFVRDAHGSADPVQTPATTRTSRR